MPKFGKSPPQELSLAGRTVFSVRPTGYNVMWVPEVRQLLANQCLFSPPQLHVDCPGITSQLLLQCKAGNLCQGTSFVLTSYIERTLNISKHYKCFMSFFPLPHDTEFSHDLISDWKDDFCLPEVRRPSSPVDPQ